jgi:hypothetical protein
VAAIHGVSVLLAHRLRWDGPPAFVKFLRDQQAHTAHCHAGIRRLLQRLEYAARENGLALTPLKGAALYAAGFYRPGERPMADLDLLVRPQQASRAIELLRHMGYRESDCSPRHVVLERDDADTPAPLGEHRDNSLKIDLHCALREMLPLRAVDISAQVFPREEQPGLNPYPSTRELLNHLLLHAAGSLCYGQLRLLHLEDIARLSARMTMQDWSGWVGQQHLPLWWSFPPLRLAARYYGCVPEEVLSETAARCHWWLRRSSRRCTLAEVSVSHLWVRAFPGIRWARTPQELLTYMMSRILPSAETVARRRDLAIEQPRVSGGSWAQLSQVRRIARWLLAPQPRHETLEPVRAALRRADHPPAVVLPTAGAG